MSKAENAVLLSLDDNQLVEKYRKKRDQAAFSELLRRHQGKVYSYLLNMVGDPEVAADLFQDTFAKFVARLDETYLEQGRFSAWLMRIAHNNAIDYIRRRRRVVNMRSSDDDDDGDFYQRLPDESGRNPFQHLELDEAKKLLLKYISRLPEEQREVLLLRHYEELSFKEIADITNVSINTALGRMRYALINLRKLFEKENGKTFTYEPT